MAAAAAAESARAGARDFAAPAARRSDPVRRLAEADCAGTLSPAGAACHRSAWDVVITSARLDIMQTPLFISTAENATYRRTIANVETTLARSSESKVGRSTWGLIVTYRPGDERTRRRLIADTKAAGLALGYDLPRMGHITVNGSGARPPAATIAAYRKIPGVLSVDRDEASEPAPFRREGGRDAGPT